MKDKFFSNLMNLSHIVKLIIRVLQRDSCILCGQTSYVGNFTVEGVRKIRGAKLHPSLLFQILVCSNTNI